MRLVAVARVLIAAGSARADPMSDRLDVVDRGTVDRGTGDSDGLGAQSAARPRRCTARSGGAFADPVDHLVARLASTRAARSRVASSSARPIAVTIDGIRGPRPRARR